MDLLVRNKEKIFIIMAIILIILFAISISPKALQNDTFYTVTIGKQIAEKGIDMQDHYSWHEGLPYTYPHWLYDLGMYQIYNLGGWTGIYISTCVLTSILGLCIFYANSKLSKNTLISFLVTIGVMYLLKGYIAARAQLVTFICFILLIYNIERFIEKRKIINAISIIIIHILIANLHVAVWPFSFVLYLPYIAEYLIAALIECVIYSKPEKFYLKRKIKSMNKQGKNPLMYETRLKFLEGKNEKVTQKRNKTVPYKITIRKRDNTKWLIIIMIIAIFTGLLTPLGKVPYTYNYLTMIGNTTKNINEHLPLTLINNTPILCTLIIIFALITFTNAKIRLTDLLMLGGLTFLMFKMRRQQSMFVLIGSIAFTRTLVDLLKNHIDYPTEEMTKRFFNQYTGAIIILLVLLLSKNMYKGVKRKEYVNESTYPVQASEWMLKNLDLKKVKLFNEYNYGSYLLYKGIPVFVDSRCDLYAPEFNTPTGNAADGTDYFMDFINTSNISTYYGDTFKKHKITHVILYKNSKINMLITKTDSEKYKELYSDDNFVIYEIIKY